VAAIRALLFDWGDTVMREFPAYDGPMVSWPRVEAMPGALEALAALSPRYTCVLASNASVSNAELMGQAVARAGLRGQFHHLWTSKELGAAKPDPAFFAAILAHLGLEPAQCIMIGNDLRKDIQGARAAGLHTIWLAEAVPEGPVPEADAVIYSMADLPGAVERLAGGG